MSMTEKLCDTVKDFPESVIAEILDFAEFLREKRRLETIEQANDEMLASLAGGLENSDAIISATALCKGAELLTLDTRLLSIVKAYSK